MSIPRVRLCLPAMKSERIPKMKIQCPIQPVISVRKVCTAKNQLPEKRGVKQRKGELSTEKQLSKTPVQQNHVKE